MATIRIEDRVKITEFDGELLRTPSGRDVHVETPGEFRWAELEIYRAEAGGYVLHRIGNSRVYHTEPTTCLTESGEQSGAPCTITELPDDAHPCWKCNPQDPQTLGDSQLIRYEFPRHTFDRCDTSAEVTRRLTTMNPRGKSRTTWVSQPAAELLRLAAEADPEFANAPKPVERIS
jgi:hypothetical protein